MGSIEESVTKVLVIGGCYGGLAAALNLHDLCNAKQSRATLYTPVEDPSRSKLPIQIKIVDERDGYYHLIGSPLVLASEKFANKAWRKYDEIPALKAPGISFLQGRATSVDCERKIATLTDTLSGEKTEESCDSLIVSTGLRREWPSVPQSLRRKEYIAEATAHIRAARSVRECVAVIGGGAVGIEMAAELKPVEPSLDVKLIHSRERLLSSEPLPDEFKDRTTSVVREGGVDLILGHRVNKITPLNKDDEKPLYNLTLSDGSELKAGHIISAVSHGVPSTDFLPANSLNEHGLVNVVPTMNFLPSMPNSQFYFAVGDIASWSGIKRCGSAMAMGHVAAVNIHQQLLQVHSGKEPVFVEFPEVPPMIALGVGKQAVVYGEKEGTTWGKDLMKAYFGEDLGFDICWNYLGLGKDGSEEEK